MSKLHDKIEEVFWKVRYRELILHNLSVSQISFEKSSKNSGKVKGLEFRTNLGAR